MPLFVLLKDKRPQDTVIITDDHRAIFLQFQEALVKVSLKTYSASWPLSLWLFAGITLISAVLTQEGEPPQ